MTSTDSAHGFRLITDYITDPARDSVVMRTRLVPLAGYRRSLSGLKVYVRYDATVDNTGGGGHTNAGANNATIDPATTALVSSDTKTPTGPFAARVTGALVANRPFLTESSGFAGTPSDGLDQLGAHHGLAHHYRPAANGNVVQTAEVDAAPGQPLTLALGFGPRAQAAIRAASGSVTLLETMKNMSSGLGLVPEQAWEDPDVPASPYGSNPATASIGFTNGKAAGSASPLIWAQAQYLRLVRDLQTGTVLDRPAITTGRYVTHGPPPQLKVSVTRTVTSGGTTLGTGTTAPGAAVDVTAARPASRANTASVVQTAAGAHGVFRVTISTSPGKTVITAAASAGKDATGWAQEKVTVR